MHGGDYGGVSGNEALGDGDCIEVVCIALGYYVWRFRLLGKMGWV
jgi:hypothetical protein